MKINYYIILFSLCIIVGETSCKKYLETKSVQSLATPSTLNDLEALLNGGQINKGTVLLNGMTDEYYFRYTDWLTRTELPKNGYIWEPQVNDYQDWRDQYLATFYANTVLYNLEFIPPNGDIQKWNNIKGAALFYRALAFHRVALLYAPQYDAGSAVTDFGIPLRLNADINEASTRANVKQTYDQMITDLNESLGLVENKLPNTNVTKTRPTKAAVYGLLARIYLQVGNYAKAKESADGCLQIYSSLMDYNNTGTPDFVNAVATSTTPFQLLNLEVIFHSAAESAPNSSSTARIDSNLSRSYAVNDLRKPAYFSINADGSSRFKGSYNVGSLSLFCGIATDEMYLIRAESYAREGNTTSAMKDLNDLLRTRWKKNSGVTTYVDQTAVDANDALVKIINERKKEFIYREIRWMDLKRLNKQTGFATTIQRNVNGQIIMLPPNDFRYSLLIPREVMNITNLQQNPR